MKRHPTSVNFVYLNQRIFRRNASTIFRKEQFDQEQVSVLTEFEYYF